MPRSVCRLLSFVVLSLLLPQVAGAQTKRSEQQERAKSQLAVQITAGRVEAVAGKNETLVVYQADARRNLRARIERVIQPKGRPTRQVFDVQAEAAVAFLDRVDAAGGASLPLRALYAQGFVRIEVRAEGRGRYLLEAEEVYLDFKRERAFLRQGELRVLPDSKTKGAKLSGSAFVVRAERLRVLGANHVVGERAQVTVCDHGKPHFALGASRIELTADPAPRKQMPPAGSAAAALGGLAGARAGAARQPTRLLSGLLRKPRGRARSGGGSDALRREGARPRLIEMDGVSLLLLPPGVGREEPFQVPLLPFFTWGTDWPVPRVRAGSSSRLGVFVQLDLSRRLFEVPLDAETKQALVVDGAAGVDHFAKRGTGGEAALEWTRKVGRDRRGEGFVRAYGIRDRADEDRVGTPIQAEGRFWLRGLVREKLPLDLRLDGEFSRLSDRGFLLEYFRSVAKQEKEQETYLHLRGAWDDLSARLLGRWRINGFQDQVERLPEARVDWITTPLLTDTTWGGLYLDAGLRGGLLRRRPDDATPDPSYRAWRGDFDLRLDYKNALGPVVLRGWAGARESLWSGRASDEEDGIDRFAARAGWNVSTLLWKRFATPWGIVRHEIVPEVGTRHTLVSRDPSELLAFDEVEQLRDQDHVYLRIRTRLLTDVDRRRAKFVDFAVESRYVLASHGAERGRSWLTLNYDLRLGLTRWLTVRARAEQDLNRGELVELNLEATSRPTFLKGLVLGASFRELSEKTGISASRALGWSAYWRVTAAWAVAIDQQYDFVTKEFLRHRGRVIRFFHRFALEVTVSHDPQQDDTSASVSVSPVFDAERDPFSGDRLERVYER